MRHLLGFFMVLAGSVMPVTVRATPPDTVTIQAPPPASVDGGRPPKWLVHTEVVGHGEHQVTYYYTNVVLTGSHMPAVIRRYKGHLQIVSGAPVNGRAFTSTIASTLSGLDPALAP